MGMSYVRIARWAHCQHQVALLLEIHITQQCSVVKITFHQAFEISQNYIFCVLWGDFKFRAAI